MAYDRREIMKAAWVIVRRLRGRTRETLHQLLSRALGLAWWEAKEAARVAAFVKAVRPHPPRPVDVIQIELVAFECKDSLRGSDWQHLHALRAELRDARRLTA